MIYSGFRQFWQPAGRMVGFLYGPIPSFQHSYFSYSIVYKCFRAFCQSKQHVKLHHVHSLQLLNTTVGFMPVVFFQPKRFYRIKRRKLSLSNREEFICKVLNIAPSDGKLLEDCTNKLQYLAKRGCKSYELVEYPGILYLSEENIDERIARLQECGQSFISIPLLKFARPENPDVVMKNSLRRYLKQQKGYLNKVDEIMAIMECSEDDILDIIKRNPRLVGTRKRKCIVEKIKCLLECGALLHDIKCNTNLLNNKTLEVIESRAKLLAEMGYNDPLPIGIIGRSDADFESIINRLSKQKNLCSTLSYIESKDIISQIPEYANKKLHVVKPKVDFLLSQGYTGEDIIGFPCILSISLFSIQDAVTYFHHYHLGLVSLEMCYKYVIKKSITSRPHSVLKLFAKVLQCSSEELPTIPKDHSVLYQKEVTICANLGQLLNFGFSKSDLKIVPIVLLHSSTIVKLHWELIQTNKNLMPYFKLWKNDRTRLLHMLQYSIEKDANFSHAIITDELDDQKQLTTELSLHHMAAEIRNTNLEPEAQIARETKGLDTHPEIHVELDKSTDLRTDIRNDADFDVALPEIL